MTELFELSAVGGPWGRLLAPRLRWLDELPWSECSERVDHRVDHRLRDTLEDVSSSAESTRLVWTRTAFAEYASAASFAEVAAACLSAGAPLDLVAACGEFVVEEMVHTVAAARVASALGGAVALEVDLERLVRPPRGGGALLRAAELMVRLSCVGESLTLPILKLARTLAGEPVIEAVLDQLVADEAGHAQLGWWFLDWADDRLDDSARQHLGVIAGEAMAAFSVLLGGDSTASGLGAVASDQIDPALVGAMSQRVIQPLAARGIFVTDTPGTSGIDE